MIVAHTFAQLHVAPRKSTRQPSDSPQSHVRFGRERYSIPSCGEENPIGFENTVRFCDALLRLGGMLEKIFGFSESKALAHAVEVDTKGTTILLTCELEKAEHKRDLIHSYGPDWRLPRSLGSMAAIVEPAAG